MPSFSLENYFLKALVASSLLALTTMVLALGLIFLFRYGAPLPSHMMLALAAISFILSASFFDRYEVGSIAWSVVVSIIITLLLTLISGGLIYFATMNRQSAEDLLSGMAICMIVSMALLNYLKRSLGSIEA
jgi:hypothetical protein